MANQNQISLYVNLEDRANVEGLLADLHAKGEVDLTDQKGNPSISALFRHLVTQEIRRQADIAPAQPKRKRL